MKEIIDTTVIEATVANKNEKLFWKVFKNIYLFKLIIEGIHTTEWISYDNHKEINVDNRIKFKYIYSLEWMIKKRQFQLLKYKIKSNANDEYIEITKIGLISLFQLSSDKNDGLDEEFKEIFTLLMKFRKLEMESVVPSLIHFTIEYRSLESFKLLLNEPFNYQILPSTIELIIILGDTTELKLLMDKYYQHNQHNNSNNNVSGQVFINEETKLKSLYLASTLTHPNEMIELILDYPQLYISHPIQHSDTLLKIQPTQFLLINSIEIQRKLLNLNCVQLESDISLLKESTGYSSMFGKSKTYKFDTLERILNYFKLFKLPEKDCNSIQLEIERILNQTKECNKIKELHKLLVLSFKSSSSIYIEYLKIYDELIDEMLESTRLITIQYCVGTLSTHLFKLLPLPTDIKLGNVNDYIIESSKISQFVKEFIKQPIDSNTIWVVNFIKSKIVSSIQSKQDYQLIMESIPIDCKLFKNQLPNEWNPLLKYIKQFESKTYFKREKLLIQDNETVDWLLKYTTGYVDNYNNTLIILNDNGRTYQPIVRVKDLFLFSNIETLNHFYQGKRGNSSIISLDIDQLESINIKSLSKSQIIELLNYLNDNDIFNEKGKSFKKFISRVLKTLDICESSNGEDEIKLENIKINFNLNVKGSYGLLVKYISKYNFKLVKLIVYNFNLKSNLNIFKKKCIELIKQVDGLYNVYGTVCTIKRMNYKNIFKLIQLFSDFILDDSGGDEFKSIIESIIQFLYNRIIQIQGITIEQVIEIHNLIQPLNMELKHSLYHAFHYINIKSTKLIKYVLNRPYLIKYLENRNDIYYDDGDNYDKEEDPNDTYFTEYNISSYLHANEFTFEYLLGDNSDTGNDGGALFDEILSKLIHYLSHTPIDQVIPRINQHSDEEDQELSNNYLTIKLNADLEYCLDIKRIDLFFQQLQFIQSLFDQGIRVGSFPNTFGINNGDSDQIEYHFKFSSDVIIKVVSLFDLNSITKLLAFNRFDTMLENTLFELLLLQHPKRTYLMDFIFNNCKIQNIFVIWNELMTTNKLYTIEHFVNNYSSVLLEVKSNSGTLMLNSNLIQDLMDEVSKLFLDRIISYFKMPKNQQTLIKFKQLSEDSQLEMILNIDFESNLYTKEFEYVDQAKHEELVSICNKVINSNAIKSLLFGQCIKISELPIVFSNVDENDNIFTQSFSNGFIKLSLLIISNYNCLIFNPNLINGNYNQVFKISKQLITNTIKNKNINIIKYYYENTNYITDDNDLLLHLKNELKSHYDYKHLNWLQDSSISSLK